MIFKLIQNYISVIYNYFCVTFLQKAKMWQLIETSCLKRWPYWIKQNKQVVHQSWSIYILKKKTQTWVWYADLPTVLPWLHCICVWYHADACGCSASVWAVVCVRSTGQGGCCDLSGLIPLFGFGQSPKWAKHTKYLAIKRFLTWASSTF